MTRRTQSLILGLILSGACLYLALRPVEFGLLWESLKTMRLKWLPAIVAIPLLDISLRALRWKWLLPPEAKTKWADLFQILCIGLALNNILPLRLGELARAYLSRQKGKISFWTALATIFVERVLDSLVILGLFLAAASFWTLTPQLDQLHQVGKILFVVLLLALVAVIFMPSLGWGLDPSAPSQGFDPVKSFRKLLRQFRLGAAALKSPARLAAVSALSLLAWLVNASIFLFTAKAMGLASVSYPHSLALLASAGASTMLPAAPGYFGTMELIVSQVLRQMVEVSPELALSLAGVSHLGSYLPVTLLGIFFLYHTGHSLREIQKEVGEKIKNK